jgi:hypothetical protein
MKPPVVWQMVRQRFGNQTTCQTANRYGPVEVVCHPPLAVALPHHRPEPNFPTTGQPGDELWKPRDNLTLNSTTKTSRLRASSKSPNSALPANHPPWNQQRTTKLHENKTVFTAPARPTQAAQRSQFLCCPITPLLLYRRIPFGRPSAAGRPCGLEIRDTADLEVCATPGGLPEVWFFQVSVPRLSLSACSLVAQQDRGRGTTTTAIRGRNTPAPFNGACDRCSNENGLRRWERRVLCSGWIRHGHRRSRRLILHCVSLARHVSRQPASV